KAEVTVPAKSRAIVPFVVSVPPKAGAGDYVGGIVAVQSSAGDGGERAAVPVELRLSGPVQARVRTEGGAADYRGTVHPGGSGSGKVQLGVGNVGNVGVKGRTTVRVHGWYGGDVSVRGPEIPDLLPGSTVPVRVHLSGVTQAIRSQVEITVLPVVAAGATGDSAPARSTARYGFWTMPWTLLGIVVLLVATAVALYRQRRRRRRAANHPVGWMPGRGPARSRTGAATSEPGH